MNVLSEVLSCLAVFSGQVRDFTLFLTGFGVKQRHNILSVAHCELRVAR